MRRRAGESFTIGGDVEVEVLEISGSKVKLGIKADQSCVILRKEVLLTRFENLTAACGVDSRTVQSLVHGLSR
jgi:carbon storage regulator CsrA